MQAASPCDRSTIIMWQLYHHVTVVDSSSSIITHCGNNTSSTSTHPPTPTQPSSTTPCPSCHLVCFFVPILLAVCSVCHFTHLPMQASYNLPAYQFKLPAGLSANNITLPIYYSSQQSGAMTVVKNQGLMCDSSWVSSCAAS